MSTLRDAMSHAVLGWVKPELDETLRLARAEVEYFAEDPTDTARMDACAAHLHQVQGTLRMVELYAPAMVAEELEQLANAVRDAAVGDRDEACGTLMRGTVLLPDYLERLQSGHRDIPIVLLPLLNDIRASRGAAGLSESVLFAPDLEKPLPPAVALPEVLSGPVRESRVDQALQSYEAGMQQWGAGDDSVDASALSEALPRLLESVEHLSTRRMLWVAASMVEALQAGAIAPGAELRQALAGVGRAVRAAGDGSRAGPAPSHEPTRQMLYLVTQSGSTHESLERLRTSFALDATSPSEAELAHARGSVSGRNRALLDTVSGAVKEELLRIKDALDLHLRTGAEVDALQVQVKELGNVADTLGMVGLGVARGVVLQQRDCLREMVEGSRQTDEDALLDIAGALLYVDASLDDQVARLGVSGAEDAVEPASSESQRTIEILAQEAINNFATAREGFVAFIETNWDHGRLADVPRLLAEVAGALRMLELPQPAEYLIGVQRYVSVELIARQRVPGGQQLDTLADAMASLEYYLEALRESRPNRDEILEITRSSLEKLRYWPLPAETDPVDAAGAEAGTSSAAMPASDQPPVALPEAIDAAGIEPVSGSAPQFQGLPEDALPAEVAEPEAEAAAEATACADGAVGIAEEEEPQGNDDDQVFASRPEDAIPEQDAVEVSEESGESEESVDLQPPATRASDGADARAGLVEADAAADDSVAMPDLANDELLDFDPGSDDAVDLAVEWNAAAPAVADVAESVDAASAGFQRSDNDIDEDIREVFLEEFDEEIVNLGQLLAVWSRSPANMEALRPIRRVFHTLKGSGRLVGATLLGEFSWNVENLLNRVLDGSRPPSPAVIGLVRQAADVLPQLNAALRGTGSVTADIEGLQAHAAQLAAGDEEAFSPAATGSMVDRAAEAPGMRAGAAESLHPHDVPAVFESDADGTPAWVDGVLREILETEVSAHLETVDAWVQRARAAPTATEEPLLRALHTMNGAFAMADVPEITAVTGGAEQYVKRLWAVDQAPSDEGVSAIADSAHAVRHTIAALQGSAPRIPVFAALASQLVSLRDTLPEPRPTVTLVDDSARESSSTTSLAGYQVAEDDALELGELDLSAYIDIEPGQQDPVDAAIDSDFEAGVVAESAGADQASAALLELLPPQDDRPVSYFELEMNYGVRPPEDRLAFDAGHEAEAETADAGQDHPIEEPAVEAADRDPAQAPETAEVAEIEGLAEFVEIDQVAESVDASLQQAPVGSEAADTADASIAAGLLETADQSEEAVEALEAADQVAEEPGTQPASSGLEGLADPIDPLVSAETPATAPWSAPLEQAPVPTSPGDALDFDLLDRDLVDIFAEEGNDLLDHSDGVLAQLRDTPEDRSLVTGLQRDLHTIKGGARMAGINAIGDLAHAIESLLEQVAANRLQLDRDHLHLLERGFDGLHGLVKRVGAHRQAPMPDGLIADFEGRAQLGDTAGSGAAEPAPGPTIALAPLSAPIDTAAPSDEEALPNAAQEQVRVRSDLLDRLVNNAGEAAIYRSRLEQQLGAFRGAMAELDRTNTRLHDQLRRLDLETEAQIVARYQREQDRRDPTFDPLELDRFSTLQQLSRGLAESAADITGLQAVLEDLARQNDSLLQQQARVSSELQDGLMRARMVPFEGLVPRLRRVLRQAATDTGKQVKLQLEGAHGELDRNVLERMTAPLEHLLRNAVAHGLEAPKARRKAGKPEEGTVHIALRREGAEMVLEVSDDGAGLNHGAIRKRAQQRGMVQPGSSLSETDLERLILESGFSTSDSISQLAGRGVGMDVVYSEVRQLGGSLDIHSDSGRGTRFTLRLPQTLAVTQAVFVEIGETQFAVPVAAVAGVGRIARERFEADGAVYQYAGEEYVLHDLGSLVGQAPARAEGQALVPLLLVRAGELRAAVAVDQVMGNREIVVKPVGPQIASVPGIYGATITGDGRIIVILDVAPLVRRHVGQPRSSRSQVSLAEERPVPLVMVVDDSLTMRKVTGRVLERHNFEVVVARDGIEALERLEERVPDLMLLDIEMPRMDGYELATAMKADPRFKDVPIVMITSRTGDKHRQRALEIGVQRYMGKPYQELDLMRNVYDLLRIARVRE